MTRRRAACLLAAVLLASCSTEAGPRYFALLNGANVVPPNTATPASATANFTVVSGGIEFNLNVQNIVGVTQAHIHGAAGGVIGNTIATLYTTASPSGPITSETIANSTLRAADLTGMTLDSLLTLMRTRQAYVDVHTSSSPGGEIRGQIAPN